jgi:hypothetical protein
MATVGNRANTGFLGNAPKNVGHYMRGANKLVVGLIGIFVVIVVGMIVYWIYQAWQRSRGKDDANPVFVAGSVNAFDRKTFENSGWHVPDTGNANSPSMAFSLSFWMYIADWNYRFGDSKAVLVKGSPSNFTNVAPGLWLGDVDNTLKVRMRTYKDGGTWEGCDVANIPLQKWVHVGYVLDNRVTDIYINGKLERSCVLKRLPWLNNQKLWLVPPTPGGADQQVGFFGQLSSVRYFSSALRPVDVARLYNEGPHATKAWDTKDATGAASVPGTAPQCPPNHPGTAQACPTCPGGKANTLSSSLNQLKGDVSKEWDSL